MRTGLLSLPVELLFYIASRLDRFALLSLSQVCRRLLYFSLSTSSYWHSDYVPAFLPVAPIGEISAAQFREAALKSWRTRCTLINLGSASSLNSDQYYPPKRITQIKGLILKGYELHQAIGSRFLLRIKRTQITFWDTYTHRKVPPISQLFNLSNPTQSSQPASSNSGSSSSLASDMSPFANSQWFESGTWRNRNKIQCDAVTSICVSTNQIRVAISWHTYRPSFGAEGFLERVTVTFKSMQNADSVQKNRVQEYSNENHAEDNEIYAEYQWESVLPVYTCTVSTGGFSTSIFRMTERYIVLVLEIDYEGYKYIRVYDWDDPLRPSYILSENHGHRADQHSISEIICTPYHLAFVSIRMSETDRKAENSVYIRPIPLCKWFPKSNPTSSANANARSLEDELREKEAKIGSIRFPGTAGWMHIDDGFKKKCEENTLPINFRCYHPFYAIGSTDTSKFDSSTFSIFISSPSNWIEQELKLEYYVLSIPEDATDTWQYCIRIVDHGSQTFSPSVFSIGGTAGSGDTVGVDEDLHKDIITSGYNGPYTFIYHTQRNQKIEERLDFLVSKGRSINWNENDMGFDAHTGIAMVGRDDDDEIIGYS